MTLGDRGLLTFCARSVFTALMNRNASRTLYYNSPGIRMGLAAGGAAATGVTNASADDSDKDQQPPSAIGTEEQETQAKLQDSTRNGSVIRSVGEQMSFGGVLGFAAGYSIRKVGKAVLFLVGTEVVILQYMAYKEWLTMDWKRLARDLAPKFSRSTWEGLVDILVYRMPFSAAFSGGLLAGLRLSAQK